MFKQRKSVNFTPKLLSSLSSFRIVFKIVEVAICLSVILSEQQTCVSVDAFVLQELPLYKIALIAHENRLANKQFRQDSLDAKNKAPTQMGRHQNHRKTPKIRNLNAASESNKNLEINAEKLVKDSKNKDKWQFPIVRMSPSEIDAKSMGKMEYYADNYYRIMIAPNIEVAMNEQ